MRAEAELKVEREKLKGKSRKVKREFPRSLGL
jgi:hypothetical protein